MWFIFQHSLPCGPHTSSIGVAAAALGFLDGTCIEALTLILKKVLNCRHDLMISSSVWYCFPAKCASWCWEQKIVRWCQIRRIWRVINQFKSSHAQQPYCNLRLVCRSIVMVKQDSFHQFSRLFWNVPSTTFQNPELLIQCAFIWKETMQLVSGRLSVMHAKFHFCGTTPSESAYELFSPPS